MESIHREKISSTDGEDKVKELIRRWTEKKEEYRDAWYDNGGWPAKRVSTLFTYQGKNYAIYPDTIGLRRGDPWDEGFLEYLQKYLMKDLEELGATEIYNLGFMD